MDLEIDVPFQTAFLEQNFRNSYALGVPNLDYLGFHNYIVITKLRLSTNFIKAVRVLKQNLWNYHGAVGLLVVFEDGDPRPAYSEAAAV